ncbi:MAG: hypothetical protein GX146_12635, partial [Myxococcales bacterium]|nr:hypothetical protein [Myxococcales bacterium]
MFPWKLNVWRYAWVGLSLLWGTGCIDLINKDFVAAAADTDTGNPNDTSVDTPPLCAKGTWDDDGNPATPCIAWTTCEAGEYIHTKGSDTVDQACARCPEGTFSNKANRAACTDYTPCDAGEYISTKGSGITDQVCAACADGTFSSEPNQDTCTPWTACVPGEFCESEGSAAADYICLDCAAQNAWDDDGDPTTPCQSWDVCRKNEYVVTDPTGLFDRVCDICPGFSTSPALNSPFCDPDIPSFTSLAAGWGHTCGIRADGDSKGLVQCWGDDYYGQSTPPADVKFTSLAAGKDHICGIRADNSKVQCWGDDYYGQSTPPEDVTFTSLTAGGYHTCAIRTDDSKAECWG